MNFRCVVFAALFIALHLDSSIVASAADSTPTRPNIVLVLIDDMGWGDFSCFGNKEIQTTNIDRLAAEGLRFEQFYVNSPICSPSRVALSTGQYPTRWQITSSGERTSRVYRAQCAGGDAGDAAICTANRRGRPPGG